MGFNPFHWLASAAENAFSPSESGPVGQLASFGQNITTDLNSSVKRALAIGGATLFGPVGWAAIPGMANPRNPVNFRTGVRSALNVGSGALGGFLTGGPLGGALGAGYGAIGAFNNNPATFGNLFPTALAGAGVGLGANMFAPSMGGMFPSLGITPGMYSSPLFGSLGMGQSMAGGAISGGPGGMVGQLPFMGGGGNAATPASMFTGGGLPSAGMGGMGGGQGASRGGLGMNLPTILGVLGLGTSMYGANREAKARQDQLNAMMAQIESARSNIRRTGPNVQTAAKKAAAGAGARGTLGSPASDYVIAKAAADAQMVYELQAAMQDQQLLNPMLQVQGMGMTGEGGFNPLAQLSGQLLMLQALKGMG